MWEIIGEKRKNGKKYYMCRCSCGTVRDVYYRSVDKGVSTSCGCERVRLQKEKAMDLTGREFGKLKVIGRDPGKHGYWICECECGIRKSIIGTSLTKKNGTKSCGCDQRKVAAKTGSRTVAKNSEKQIARNMEYHTNFQVIGTDELPKNNTSGHKGVWYDRSRGLWQAYIQVHGQKKFLGRYAKKEDAIAARVEAEEEYFKPLLEEAGL